MRFESLDTNAKRDTRKSFRGVKIAVLMAAAMMVIELQNPISTEGTTTQTQGPSIRTVTRIILGDCPHHLWRHRMLGIRPVAGWMIDGEFSLTR